MCEEVLEQRFKELPKLRSKNMTEPQLLLMTFRKK